MGTRKGIITLDGESPLRRQRVTAFLMDNVAVSNARFGEFVDATNYVTEAERIGWSYVFFDHLSAEQAVEETQGVAEASWWRQVFGANWRLINGPGSENAWQPNNPVVHISYNDAMAFAEWAGGRLPIEAEWEHAARGGQDDVLFPWGNREPNDSDFFPCNIWQGRFPHTNTEADGYSATAPVDTFQPNAFGLFNIVGNTWEWTASPYTVRAQRAKARKHAARMRGSMVLKGGSFLCHKSYCYRYRIAARSGTTPDSTTSHIGFRLVYDT